MYCVGVPHLPILYVFAIIMNGHSSNLIGWQATKCRSHKEQNNDKVKKTTTNTFYTHTYKFR